jgi:hypothetical protein
MQYSDNLNSASNVRFTLSHIEGCSKMFGKCYSIFYRPKTTWMAARDECLIRKHRLVSIHYAKEQQLLKAMLRNFRYTDLGVYKIETAFSELHTSHLLGQHNPIFNAHIGKLLNTYKFQIVMKKAYSSFFHRYSIHASIYTRIIINFKLFFTKIVNI